MSIKHFHLQCLIQLTLMLIDGIRFSSEQNSIGVGDEGGARAPQIREKYFWTIVMSNLGIFGQKSCKIREFC